MVSPYFTLLFSRKEITKFSELALVSVHFNCLIGCIVIMRGYWLWNTANTTADIYLLVENRNKNTKTKFKVCSNFFYQPYGCPKANFGPLTKRYPHSLFQVRPKGHRELRNEVESPTLIKRVSGIRAGHLSNLSVTILTLNR